MGADMESVRKLALRLDDQIHFAANRGDMDAAGLIRTAMLRLEAAERLLAARYEYDRLQAQGGTLKEMVMAETELEQADIHHSRVWED